MPEVLRGLNIVQARTVVKYAHRGLAKVHHPDSGGTPERMARINAANAELEGSDFPRLLREYMHRDRKRDKARQMDVALATAQTTIAQQFQNLLSYNLCHFGLDVGANIRTAKNILVLDVVADMRRRQLTRWTNGLFTVTYRLDIAEGTPTRRYYTNRRHLPEFLDREVSFPEKRIFGALDERTVLDFGGLSSILILFGLESIETENDVKRLHSSEKSRLLRAFDNEIPVERFRAVAGNLVPYVDQRDSLIFALNIREGKVFVSLEGKVYQDLKSQ